MIQTARIISIYSADTSGVCSALYELGGMTVVHDASGCNSTYSTHDEPRWYDMDSMIYISALTETDAILGNDEKLIADVTDAAKKLNPEFIALCGSPMPMMTGTDFDAIANEIKSRTGIVTFALHTNGMHSYLLGASEAFVKIAEHFCKDNISRTASISANILGATPLDFSLNGSIEAIKALLAENNIETVSCFAMGCSIDEISRAGSAWVNLVVSYDGLAAARTLYQKFGTPFVCGIPNGEKYAEEIAERLKTAAKTGKPIYSCAERSGDRCNIAVVGESVAAGSLARALEADFGLNAAVLCPLETDEMLFAKSDRLIPNEDDFAVLSSQYKTIIADPMYKPVCNKNTEFIPLASEAFSGRCYARTIPNIIGKKFDYKMLGKDYSK